MQFIEKTFDKKDKKLILDKDKIQLCLTIKINEMEKLQLMMFEAIGYKLTFNPEVTNATLTFPQTRFGKNSEMENT